MQTYSRHPATCQLLALTSSGHTAHAPARGVPKTATRTVAMFLPQKIILGKFQGAPCYDHGVPTAAQVPSNLVTTIQGLKLHLVPAINL